MIFSARCSISSFPEAELEIPLAVAASTASASSARVLGVPSATVVTGDGTPAASSSKQGEPAVPILQLFADSSGSNAHAVTGSARGGEAVSPLQEAIWIREKIPR